MEIEIKSKLNNDEESQENNENEENNRDNNHNNNINKDHSETSKKLIQENKISLSAKVNIKFGLFCDLLEKCMKQKSKVKSQLIMTFFNKYFSKEDNLFPIMRLLFPKLDKSRYNYGLQERGLAKMYSEILSLPENERDLLKNWKNPNYKFNDAPSGDFVKVLVFSIKNRVSTQSRMMLNEVNDFLDELYVAVETKDKSACLTRLIKNSSLLEQKWIIQIILKDLKIGVGHETVLKLFHPKALDVYNSTSSLLEVCNFIQNPQNPKFSENFYRVNLPIKPMLASRMTLQDIIDNFMSVPTIVETKYDGERIQCHFKEGQIKFFTRNAVDYTDLYGPRLASYLAQAITAKCAILDGEVVVWDKKNNKFSAFGENKAVALKNRNNLEMNNFIVNDDEEEDKELVYMVFDIIYLVSPSGQEISLQEVVLADRKKVLSKVVRNIPNKIQVVQGFVCNNIEEIFSHFNKSIENQEEGIIIKKLESTYKLDDRTRDWVKMKCDYIDSLVDTMDLAIIGGYFGEGKRVRTGINNDSSDYITTFLMGVVKKLDKENPKNSVVLPFVKVGTGYTIGQLETIRTRMKGLWKKYDTRLPPKLYGNWTPAVKERPDVYVEDVSTTIILELKAAEITASDSFPTRLTLRFPRVLNVRFDKGIYEAMKYEEVLEFYQNFQHNFLMKKKRKIEENAPELNNEGVGKEAKVGGRKVKYSRVMDDFLDTETNNLTRSSNLFRNCEFLFLNLDDNITNNLFQKRTLEASVVEHGGSKVQNYLPSTTTHVVASKLDIRAQNILKKNEIDIYKPKWVHDSIKYKKLMHMSPFYLAIACKNTQYFFSTNYDCFGDSFYEDINPETLKEIFANIKIDKGLCEKVTLESEKIKSGVKNKINIPAHDPKVNQDDNNFRIKDEEFQKVLRDLTEEFHDCEWLRKLSK